MLLVYTCEIASIQLSSYRKAASVLGDEIQLEVVAMAGEEYDQVSLLGSGTGIVEEGNVALRVVIPRDIIGLVQFSSKLDQFLAELN